MKKINLALIMGGMSGEHTVSLLSAYSIFKALNKKKYRVFLVGVDKKGVWHLGKDEKIWLNPGDSKKTKLNTKMPLVWPIKNYQGVFLEELKNVKKKTKIDIFFPIIHGTFGEDGTLQGFLEILGSPYIGPDTLGSSLGMDKDVMKRIFSENKIPTADFVVLKNNNFSERDIKSKIKKLGWPIFVKPANLGSSVGISCAKNFKELREAIKAAFYFDKKIILEKSIFGREIECSVLGNFDEIEVSLPGEIKLNNEFYSYEAKYLKDDLALPVPVANLDKKTVTEIKKMAKRVFQILECEGMGRVDFFLDKKGKIIVNEINTLPGFTNISMYPKMWESSGLEFSALLDKLIKLAFERKIRQNKLRRSLK